MENVIKETLREFPGITAKKILNLCKKYNYQNITRDTIYKHLRKLKRKGTLVNKGDRWYLNNKL
ncbi:hypothetical protein [Alkalihalobacterium elongatum]|uniref:hypothetical protein n=1 Tax=Alkalihalobacterium elongatum TaxID=2675466 RepID=UPI001C1F25B7|nr:hypothetical protein [Alkalihalobacterium elongatum]